MKLLLKFNLVFILVFALGLAATGFVSWTLLERNARDEIAQNARLLMDTALAARTYTSTQVNPLLETQMKYTFLPQSVPAYSATEVFNDLRKKHSEYGYKEAVLNPTNPRNRATDWEADLIQTFRNDAAQKELMGERDTPTGRSLYIARPIQIKNPACLACHSVPSAAPKSMLKLYGEANGFGWKHNEIVGAQVVSVPMSLPIHNAERAFRTFMSLLAAVFAAVFLVLNVMLSWMIVRPIHRMSKAADRVSTGDFQIEEFSERGKDEIAVLGASFNRMRRSLQKAMQMIEG